MENSLLNVEWDFEGIHYLIAGYSLFAIQEDNAGHPMCTYCCFNPSNFPRLQWSLAQCYKVAKCVEIGLPELVLLVIFSQYLAHLIRPGKNIFDRFVVLFMVIIVWIYTHLLTVGEAYNGKPPKTQSSCRTDFFICTSSPDLFTLKSL